MRVSPVSPAATYAEEATMADVPRPLDVVALTHDLPEHGLRRGQVGTVVECLSPRVIEVDFSDNAGRTYACVAVPAAQLMVLHHDPVTA